MIEDCSEDLKEVHFSRDKSDFLKKVYGLLSLQLLFTSMFCYITVQTKQLEPFIKDETIFLSSIVFSIASICGMYFYSKSYPLNILLLVMFTICESFIISRICFISVLEGKQELVLLALSTTTTVFISLSAFAAFTKKDFTYLQNLLYVGTFTLLVLFVSRIFIISSILDLFMCWFGILLFSGFILYDTSLIFNKFGPDDAIIATLNLYLDFINMFLMILQLLNQGNGS